MIIDAHAHAWRRWPYEHVPDPDFRGSLADLDHEMTRAGVEHALLVAARIGGADEPLANADNNALVAAAVTAHPSRFSAVADIDSFWTSEHHTPGAAERLDRLAEELPLAGFTHYVRGEDDGWFDGADADGLMSAAAARGMIASLHAPPAWHRAVGDLAERHPAVPVLLHHQGLAADPEAADGLLALASVPNVYVKASGFHYLVSRPWSYPFAEARPGFRRLVEEFGADRMVWGSDYPVCAKYGVGYRQSLEVVRTECDFLDERELGAILGGTAAALLGRTVDA